MVNLYNNYLFDENGQLIKENDANAAFVYNWDGKLQSALADGNSMAIKYDPAGNRIYKASSEAGTCKYIVDCLSDLPVILLVLDPDTGVVKKTYLYANNLPIAQYAGDSKAEKYFYLYDRLGSVRVIIDSDGDEVQSYTYSPYGRLLENEGSFENPFRFTGQYFDSETGEYYLRNRQLRPSMYRFTSRDAAQGKFENPLSFHRYLYCQNEPISWVDPWGLDRVSFYDWADEGGPGMADGANFTQAATDNYFDWNFRMSSIRSAVFWLGVLQDLNVSIDDVYVFDHGNAGFQEFGNDKLSFHPAYADELPWLSQDWSQLAGMVEEKGTIHLRGCNVAKGNEGLKFIMLLARLGDRNVTAFDETVTYTGEVWGAPDYYSFGNLWLASPSGGLPVNISSGKWLGHVPGFRPW